MDTDIITDAQTGQDAITTLLATWQDRRDRMCARIAQKDPAELCQLFEEGQMYYRPLQYGRIADELVATYMATDASVPDEDRWIRVLGDAIHAMEEQLLFNRFVTSMANSSHSNACVETRRDCVSYALRMLRMAYDALRGEVPAERGALHATN